MTSKSDNVFIHLILMIDTCYIEASWLESARYINKFIATSLNVCHPAYIIFHTMQYWVHQVLQRYFHLLFMAHLKLHVPAIGLKRAFLLNSFWVEPHGKFTSRSQRTSPVPCRPICPVEPISVREQCINLFPSNSDWNFKHFRTSIWMAEFTSNGSVTKWPRPYSFR